MASSMEPPAPLKSKLSQVKYLLDDANERLQEEASKFKIFTTKTSASSSSAAAGAAASLQQNGDQNDVPNDLMRTISDISALKSVLSCPIFNRIVNVTDSLDKLSYHLNLHPSIGPSDINIDANGELILAPPIEPTSMNNFINTRLDEYADPTNSNNNGAQIVDPDIVHQNNQNQTILNDQQHIRQQHSQAATAAATTSTTFDGPPLTEMDCSNNGFVKLKHEQAANLVSEQQQQFNNKSLPNSYVPFANIKSSINVFDTEKLVANGTNNNNKTYVNNNNNNARHHHETKVDPESNGDKVQGHYPQIIYKSNGHFNPDQVVASNNMDLRNNFQSTQSMDHVGDHVNGNSKRNGSNELHKTSHELNQSKTMAIEHQQATQLSGQDHNLYLRDSIQSQNMSANGKVQSSQTPSVQYNRGSCSPSTSAGSTVRLADECDSGASSYQSQTAKGTPYSPQPYKPNEPITMDCTPIAIASSNEDKIDSREQDLIDNLAPEMERIKVTLEKDHNGLGITIAGYTCEKDEISGIFIKSITPNSPADRSGKIRTLDQIFAVNGRELLGYSNPEALNVLRQTGPTVTLELMRYLAESKYRILQTALAHAVPTMGSGASKSFKSDVVTIQNSAQSSANSIASPTRSSIPVSKMRDHNQSPTKLTSPMAAKPTFVQVSNIQRQTNVPQSTESIYKNEAVTNEAEVQSKGHALADKHSINQSSNTQVVDLQSQVPVAAQRGGTNKVIETKQGARNTIDIRSPIVQATTATYVNKSAADTDFYASAKKSMTSRLEKEASDEFGRLIRSEEPEWEKDAEIIELYKDTSQGLGFTVKEYANPKDQKQSIIMITSLTQGGVAERDGRLSFGDLLIFVDDTNLEGASLTETVRALKKTNGQVRLGVLKLKRGN